MTNWNSLLQMLGAAGISATIVAFILKKIIEKTIAHSFDRKLKEIEARIRESSELRIMIGRNRIEEYQKLSSLVLSVRKYATRLCENPNLNSDEVSSLSLKAKDLEGKVYDLAVLLRSDGLYERLHKYKDRLITLTMNLDNEIAWHAKGERKRAEAVREIITCSNRAIESEAQSIINIITRLIVPPRTEDR